MLSTIFDSTSIPVVQEVVNFAQSRHNVLAGNLANLDTPGYRVQDLSVDTFQQRLREAIAARNEKRETMSPGLSDSTPGDELREVRDSIKTILFHDGSDVGLEQQVAELSKNQFMHNLAITIMNSQFQMLQTAISERINT